MALRARTTEPLSLHIEQCSCCMNCSQRAARGTLLEYLLAPPCLSRRLLDLLGFLNEMCGMCIFGHCSKLFLDLPFSRCCPMTCHVYHPM